MICKGVKNLKKRFLDVKEFSIPKVDIMNNQEVLACFDKISKSYNYDNIEANMDIEYSFDSDSILNKRISEIEVGVAIRNAKKDLLQAKI